MKKGVSVSICEAVSTGCCFCHAFFCVHVLCSWHCAKSRHILQLFICWQPTRCPAIKSSAGNCSKGQSNRNLTQYKQDMLETPIKPKHTSILLVRTIHYDLFLKPSYKELAQCCAVPKFLGCLESRLAPSSDWNPENLICLVMEVGQKNDTRFTGKNSSNSFMNIHEWCSQGSTPKLSCSRPFGNLRCTHIIQNAWRT